MSNPSSPTPSASTPKKRSLGKLLLRLFGVFVLLIVVGIAVLYFARNALVRAGVIRGGTYATEQETLLNAADLALSGNLDLSQLQIHNPKSYKEPQFLKMQDCNVVVQPASLFSSEVVVDSIKISGLEITVEQNGAKNNLSELLAIMKTKSPAAAPAANSPAPESPGKKLAIHHIDLAATKVHLRGMVTMDLDLPPIHLDDITNPDGRPVKIADVLVKVLLHVAQQIVNDPRLPGDFKNGLKDVSALVDHMKGDLNKSLKDISKNPRGAATELKTLEKDAGNLEKGLQNLLPGNKPPASQPK